MNYTHLFLTETLHLQKTFTSGFIYKIHESTELTLQLWLTDLQEVFLFQHVKLISHTHIHIHMFRLPPGFTSI